MNTENQTNSPNISANSQPYESKEELNERAPTEFGLSVTLGVITILLIAATAYLGLIKF
ncbi:hypothetical protein NIES4075_33020 [Tolypothrix sp. NIES-4075]|nr:hypothetical protein NIES4075_33020 [Tolypothrix sp. NIES-4075]